MELQQKTEKDGRVQELVTSESAPVDNVKTSPSGVVLDPQPSDDPQDPLNWSPFTKNMAWAIVIFTSFMCFFSIIAIVTATLTLADDYGVDEATAVYIGSTPTLVYAVAPFLYAPLSHVIGRRSVMLGAELLAICFSVGVALSHTYAQTLTLRLFQGFGASASLTLGPAIISDMFFTHERGKRMGVYVLFLVTSPFIGAVIGGPLDSRLGWQWSMWVSAIGFGACWILHYLFVPETIYVRGAPPRPGRGLARILRLKIPQSSHRQSFARIFTRPFLLFTYPACILPCFWFSLTYATQVAITSEFSIIFGGPPFNFTTIQIGLVSFSGVIGGVLGELCAGPVIDWIVKRQIARGRQFEPEMRLQAIWPGIITVPIGLIVFGAKTQFVTSWVAPLVGVAFFVFGQEILTTVIQTYIVECFPQQAAEVSLVFNFWRNLNSFWPPFFMTRWGERIGFALPYGVWAIIAVVSFPILMGPLMWKGKAIRQRWGTPSFGKAT